MRWTSKSFGVLFTAWGLMLVILAYCFYINTSFKMDVVTDGVVIPSLNNPVSFFPKSNFTLFFGLIICLSYIFYKIYTKNGRELNISQDAFLVILLVACISVFFSFLQQINTFGLANSPTKLITSSWTTKQIKEKIQNLIDYQGDSLVIYQDGTIKSKDAVIQSVIMQMYIVPANLQDIRAKAAADNYPEAYYAYKTAIFHYKNTYGDKNKKQ